MGDNRKALLVGISDYKVLGELSYAKYDAELMAEALSEYNAQFSCTVLTDEMATARRIRDEFKRMLKESDDNALLIFFYAGHAVIEEGVVFLVTLDSEYDVEEGVYLRRLVDIITANRKEGQTCIIILDCCHAAAFPLHNTNILLNTVQTTLLGSAGIVLIAATEAQSKAYEYKALNHGLLTHWLFQAVTGDAADEEGKVTVTTLYEYIASGMVEYSKSQRPVLKMSAIGSSPVIADGFPPRISVRVKRLTGPELERINNTLKVNLERLTSEISSLRDTNDLQRYKIVSAELTQLISWRRDLEATHPELKEHAYYLTFRNDILRIQAILADVTVGIDTPEGKVVGIIGEGGFGKVYELVNINDEKRAYKVYHANQLHDKQKLKAFRRGYNAMERLSHPHIVDVYKYSEAPIAFSMRYVPGPNFRDWWTDDIPTMIEILLTIAETLHYAHQQGVIHRDIKPENIIIATVDTQPVAYLTDFDLAWYSMATTYSSMGSANAVFGHYLYAAPEQYESPEAEVTRRHTTDIYGFGQLCYFAVVGKDPVKDQTIPRETLKERLQSWDNGEAAQLFLDLYIKCTKRSPNDRYVDMEAISIELMKIKALLLDPDYERSLTEEGFLKELTFLLFGLGVDQRKSFQSATKLTEVGFSTLNDNRIVINFTNIQRVSAVQGTFQRQREVISRRIDQALTDLRNRNREYKINRLQGDNRVGLYNTAIEITGPSLLTLQGVLLTKETIKSILSSMES